MFESVSDMVDESNRRRGLVGEADDDDEVEQPSNASVFFGSKILPTHKFI